MKTFKLFLLFLLMTGTAQAQGIITAIAGTGVNGYNGDWIAASTAQLSYFGKVVIDKEGNIYLSDVNRIRRIDRGTGIITTICGNGTPASTGDGGLAINAQIDTVSAFAINSLGDIFLHEMGIPTVRKIEKATGIITTIAGTGTVGHSGDNGQATNAELPKWLNITVGKNDDLYVSGGGRIRKVTTGGIITTVVSTGGPGMLCTDTTGNVLFIDLELWVKKIDISTGSISTLAGQGIIVADDIPAVDAHIDLISDIAADRFGNIYLCHYTEETIRQIDAAGIIHTVVGLGPYTGNNVPADSCILSYPGTITTDSCGNLYIYEAHTPAIRKVTYDDCYPLNVVRTEQESESVSIYPNPASSTVTVSSSEKIASVSIVDVTGREVMRRAVSGERVDIDVSGMSSGVYFVRWFDSAHHDSGVVKFVRE